MCDHIIKFLNNNNLFSDQQHGFWNKISCESQLTYIDHNLAGIGDKKPPTQQLQIDTILLDFFKAFDKVPTRRFSAKRSHYSIMGKDGSTASVYTNIKK